jgi:hypothetical protein
MILGRVDNAMDLRNRHRAQVRETRASESSGHLAVFSMKPILYIVSGLSRNLHAQLASVASVKTRVLEHAGLGA